VTAGRHAERRAATRVLELGAVISRFNTTRNLAFSGVDKNKYYLYMRIFVPNE